MPMKEFCEAPEGLGQEELVLMGVGMGLGVALLLLLLEGSRVSPATICAIKDAATAKM